MSKENTVESTLKYILDIIYHYVNVAQQLEQHIDQYDVIVEEISVEEEYVYMLYFMRFNKWFYIRHISERYVEM